MRFGRWPGCVCVCVCARHALCLISRAVLSKALYLHSCPFPTTVLDASRSCRLPSDTPLILLPTQKSWLQSDTGRGHGTRRNAMPHPGSWVAQNSLPRNLDRSAPLSSSPSWFWTWGGSHTSPNALCPSVPLSPPYWLHLHMHGPQPQAWSSQLPPALKSSVNPAELWRGGPATQGMVLISF